MSEWNEETQQAWHTVHGDRRIPGSAEPEDGKCGSVLKNTATREVEEFLSVPRGSLPPRHCTKGSGWGTDHVGFGPCKLHTGSTPNVQKKYLPMAMSRDLHTLAELWEEEVGLDPAPVEAERLLRKMKKTMLVFEQLAVELSQMESTDDHGHMQVRPIMELWERAVERYMDIIKFALKFNLEERRVQIEETQARDIAGALLSVVIDPTLQLSDAQITQIRTNLGRVMGDLAPALRPDWAQEFDAPFDYDLEVEDE